jgi:hypothetical protein
MYEFIEESFDLEKSYEYILSIQLRLDGFSFLIEHEQNKTIAAFKHTPVTISQPGLITRRFQDWVNQEAMLQKTYAKQRLVYFSEHFSLIPEKLYDASQNENIANILFNTQFKTELVSNIIMKPEARLIFALPDGLHAILANLLGNYNLLHPMQLALNKLQKYNLGLILIFNGKSVMLTALKNDKIELINNFVLHHSNDFFYYVLTALKEIELSAKTTPVFYGGNSEYLYPVLKESQKYFNTVQPFELSLQTETAIPKQLISDNFSLFL